MLQKILNLFLIVVCLLSFSSCSHEISPFKIPEEIKEKENLSEEGFRKKLDAYLTQSTEKDEFSGVVLVAKEGKTIFKKAYGMADRELNIPNTLNTRFSLASINKTFTAAAIAQLEEQGKLSYDDLIGKYLGADWIRPEVGKKVKICHLLTHTSGIGEYLTDDLLGKYLTTEDYKALTRIQTLSYEPGEKWQYCNTGFILLGAIIKKASGANYEEYVKKHIFEPAGMERTLISSSDKGLADVAMPYGSVDNEGSRQKTVLAGKVNGSSAGGGYSTVEDLLKFAAALEANKLITRESAKLLMSAKPGLNARNYGYGFFIYNHPRLGLVVGHGGVAPGVSSNFRMFVDIGYTMIILSNYDEASLKVWSKIQTLLSQAEF
jgi:CubicO group peptidase (beta-lactamase class C family)